MADSEGLKPNAPHPTIKDEAKAVMEDAERYRWLRNHPEFQIAYTGEKTLDEHIDAAMAEANSVIEKI